MKVTDKKKSISTIPKGVWESTRPIPDKEKSTTATETTDLQGNGYPQKKSKQLGLYYVQGEDPRLLPAILQILTQTTIHTLTELLNLFLSERD